MDKISVTDGIIVHVLNLKAGLKKSNPPEVMRFGFGYTPIKVALI
jgi:hypothetical protein